MRSPGPSRADYIRRPGSILENGGGLILENAEELARSKPRHLAPQPKTSPASVRTGLAGVIDAVLAAQHVLEMFRRALPDGTSRSCLDRLSNRLTKIVAEARKLATP